ncbi:unnamed protein product [Periconia digitata]|uniref:Cytochrome P450 n=1 Tax=Periconia digitata TaxID=1303443 RepID=A0A9W4UQU9_9PLEO|nr:unnamed protein product [Periconia digitata]
MELSFSLFHSSPPWLAGITLHVAHWQLTMTDISPVGILHDSLKTTLQSNTAKSVAVVLLLLFAWRFWKFTLQPLLHPEYPKEYPYWIPSFFKDSNLLIAQARQYFAHEGNEPFALTVLGITFYVATQAKHSAEVYKNTETLSFESFVQALMRNNGNCPRVIKLMYSALPVDKRGFPNPHGESLGVMAQRMHIIQLHPNEKLVGLQHQTMNWIDTHLTMDMLKAEGSDNLPPDAPVEFSLYQWCSNTFTRLGQHIYFGETLHNIDPGVPDAFLVFDELIWKMLYQYPDFLSRDMSAPRARVIKALQQYFEIPREKRAGKAAWLIDTFEDEVRALGIDNENLATMMFHLYLAINTNARKTVFWVISYLLHNPNLLEAYRRDTEVAFSGDRLVDPFVLQNPEKCPQVDAIWNETLRITGWSASVRSIIEDTVIGGKLMRKGNRVLVPHRLLHFDENIFGSNPQEFRPERWENGLKQNASWKPFGGGKTTCSGRFLARFSATTYVATLLRRFDIKMVGNPPFPQADAGRPVLGTMSIKDGSDFKVQLSPRANL